MDTNIATRSTSLTCRVYLIAIVLLTLDFLVLAAYFAAMIFLPGRWLASIVGLLIGVLILYISGRALIRIPLVTRIKGDQLTTYGFMGVRHLDLTKLAEVQVVAWLAGQGVVANGFIIPGPGFTNNALRLVSSNGHAAPLHLGSIPRRHRAALYTALMPYLDDPQVQREDYYNETMQKWLLNIWHNDHKPIVEGLEFIPVPESVSAFHRALVQFIAIVVVCLIAAIGLIIGVLYIP